MEITSKFYLSISLKDSEDLLIKFGGHKQAAGFTIQTDKINDFRVKINSYAEKHNIKDLFEPTKTYDIEVEIQRINNDFEKAISKLAPFGVGNPEPVIRLDEIPIENPKLIGKNKDSTSFRSDQFQCIKFNDAEIAKSGANKISVLTNLRKSCYNNNIIQFLLKDYKFDLLHDPNVINYKLRNSNAHEISELLAENAQLEKLDRKLLIEIYKIAELSKNRGVFINQLLKKYNLSLFDLFYILNIFKELKLLDFQIENDLVKFNINNIEVNLEDSKLLKLYQKKETNGFS